jgi:selenide,water dikinase
LASEFDVRAATDITGFGLLGHASEIAEASSVGLSINLNSIPFLHNAYAYAEDGNYPGGSANNMRYYRSKIIFEDGVDRISRMLLFDAQTSGGLLLMVPRNSWDDFSAKASQSKIPAWPIGNVEDGEQIRVVKKAHEFKGSVKFQDDEIAFLSEMA